MIIFHFNGSKSSELPEQYTFGCPDFASGVDTLTWMINSGWALSNIRVSFSRDNMIYLPVEALGGDYIEEPLQKLQQEWEALLLINT